MKMDIIFAHNVYNRHITLLETIKKEKLYFPNAKIIVAYNNKSLDLSEFQKLPFKNDITFIYFKEETHKIGCANGFIHSVGKAVESDANVIFFSHDDVSINHDNIDIFKKNIELIENGDYNVICRTPKNNYGNNYYMMEGVFMCRKSIRNFFKIRPPFSHEEDIPKDIRGSISPEVFLYNFLNRGLKIKCTPYDNSSDLIYNKQLGETLGIYHKNIGVRGWTDK